MSLLDWYDKTILYRETGLIPLSERRKQHRLILFHKMVHKRAPDYLNELVPPMVSHTYFTRNNQNLQEIKCRTSSYQNSFLPKTVRDWNLLSAETKNTESQSAFKDKISTKPCVLPPYYHAGSRPGQILHSRLRLNNIGLNDHLFRYGLVDTPSCICGANIESSRHFLLHCPIYINIRNRTIGQLQLKYNVNYQILLYGSDRFSLNQNEDIFLTVQQFLLESNRFNIKL